MFKKKKKVDKQTQEQMLERQEKLRFVSQVMRNKISKEDLKQVGRIKSLFNRRMSLTEVDDKLNSVAMKITAPVFLNLLVEDTETGNSYFFTDLQIYNQVQGFRVINFIEAELNQFLELESPQQLFLAFNAQYNAEVQLKKLQAKAKMQQNGQQSVNQQPQQPQQVQGRQMPQNPQQPQQPQQPQMQQMQQPQMQQPQMQQQPQQPQTQTKRKGNPLGFFNRKKG